MSLPNISLGDPHVAAHNAERDLLNKLQNLSDTTFLAALVAAYSGATYAVNAQTGTTYTAILGDAGLGKLTTFDNAAPIAYTIPPNSAVAYPVGSVLKSASVGAGQVTITPGVGVVFLGGAYKSGRQGAIWEAIKIATNLWIVNGDVTA